MGGLMMFAMPAFYVMRIPKPLEDTEVPVENTPFNEIVKSTIRLIKLPKMMILNMQLMWTGVTLAIYTGMLVPIMIL